jgi:hypothetical protein
MTVEIHDKLIALLAGVDELKIKEAQLKSEKSVTWSKSQNLRAKSAAAVMNSATFEKTNLG